MAKPTFILDGAGGFTFSRGQLTGEGTLTPTGATFEFAAGRLSGEGTLNLAQNTLTIEREVETGSDKASDNAPDHRHLPDLTIPVPPPLLDLLM